MSENDDGTWPPAPTSTTAPTGPSTPIERRKSPYLRVIAVMWGVTAAQILLQPFFGVRWFIMVLGFTGTVLSLYLAPRNDKAARINGGLRVALWLLGIVWHFMDPSTSS